MTKEEFVNDIFKHAKNKPRNWRLGQFVFNYIDETYEGLATAIQFEIGVDCFYRDDLIDDFINEAYKLLNNKK